jgi:hypothetical protein
VAMKKTAIIFLILLFFSFSVYAEEGDYKNYTQLINSFKQLTRTKNISLKIIGKSDSGKNLYALMIGNNNFPAVFIGANISGFDLAASESSLNLAKYIIMKIKNKDKNYINKCFYIIPVLNPDLYSVSFKKPLENRVKNYTPKDDDGDGLTDEDPPEDLNKDGYITIMRVKAVDGRYIEDKGFPYKLKKADPVKGERGIYKYYVEGIDNDGDGKFNEDPKGGVIINNNFPVLFKYNNKSSGLYPVSEKTTKTIIEFILKHKNIVLAYIIDRTNNMIKLLELGRTSKLGDTKVKIPKSFGKFLGLDTTKKYSLKELVKILKEAGIGRGMNLTEEMVASFLGVAPPASVDANDYKYYKQLSEEYKKIAKKDKINIKRVVKGEEDGSLIKWFYFNTGILPMGVDVWSLPKAADSKKKDGLTIEKLKKMSKEEFLKIDDKLLEKFFKKMNVPPSFNVQMVKNMVKAGRITPEKMAGFMEKYKSKNSETGKSKNKNLKNYIEKELKGKGIIKWRKFNHPQLGNVEIGGIIPYIGTIPKYDKIKKNEKLIEDFFNLLIKKTPEIKIEGIKITKQKTGVYKVKFYIVNEGYIPFYLNMGKRNRYSMPILIKLNLPKDSILIEGKKLNKISDIGGIGSAKEINYLILPGKNKKIKIIVHHEKIIDIVRTFDLGGIK